MEEIETAVRLRRHLADWSDTALPEARTLVESFRALIPRDLANSQLYGILTIARNIDRNDEIETFFKNQAMKAERAGRPKEKMLEFWQQINAKFEDFYDKAREIAINTNQSWANNAEAIAKIQRQLLLKFIQHVIAEKVCLERQEKEGNW